MKYNVSFLGRVDDVVFLANKTPPMKEVVFYHFFNHCAQKVLPHGQITVLSTRWEFSLKVCKNVIGTFLR